MQLGDKEWRLVYDALGPQRVPEWRVPKIMVTGRGGIIRTAPMWNIAKQVISAIIAPFTDATDGEPKAATA